MGWSTLGDLCIHAGKLLSCSSYRNSVGVWVADVAVCRLVSFRKIVHTHRHILCTISCYYYAHYLSSTLKKIIIFNFNFQLIEPYGASSVSGQKEPKEQKPGSAFKNSLGSKSTGSDLMTSNLQSLSPDYETKEIKNIYIDSKSSFSGLQRELVLIFL